MTLPMNITELGRIRIGDRVPIAKGKHQGQPRPHKLTQFRFTGNNPVIMAEIADKYGGDVQRWEVRPEWDGVREPTHKWELYTTTDRLDVMIPAASEVSTCREIWDAGGCAHRCDAETRVISHEDTAARIGTVCHEETCQEVARVSVMLMGVHGFGTWRLDTKGYYASSEIRGFLTWLAMCGIQFAIKASLTLEEREVRRHKPNAAALPEGEAKSETLKFVVPVFQPDYTPDQLMVMAGQHQTAQLAPPVPQLAQPIETTIDELCGAQNGAAEARQAAIRPRQPGTAETAVIPDAGPPWTDAEHEELAPRMHTILDTHATGTMAQFWQIWHADYPDAHTLDALPADYLRGFLDRFEDDQASAPAPQEAAAHVPTD